MNILDKVLGLLINRVPLGRWLGVPIYLHTSWLIVLALFLFLNTTFALIWRLLFCIVLMHEFGHIFAGKYFGCKTGDITLFPFGGAASMSIPEKPEHELVVALAGPAVNVALMHVFWPLAGYHEILATLNLVNITLIVFNIIPAFPMDGGRVLRALLSRWSRNRLWPPRSPPESTKSCASSEAYTDSTFSSSGR